MFRVIFSTQLVISSAKWSARKPAQHDPMPAQVKAFQHRNLDHRDPWSRRQRSPREGCPYMFHGSPRKSRRPRSQRQLSEKDQALKDSVLEQIRGMYVDEENCACRTTNGFDATVKADELFNTYLCKLDDLDAICDGGFSKAVSDTAIRVDESQLIAEIEYFLRCQRTIADLIEHLDDYVDWELNLRRLTGRKDSQYHLSFEDRPEAVPSLEDELEIERQLNELLRRPLDEFAKALGRPRPTSQDVDDARVQLFQEKFWLLNKTWPDHEREFRSAKTDGRILGFFKRALSDPEIRTMEDLHGVVDGLILEDPDPWKDSSPEYSEWQ